MRYVLEHLKPNEVVGICPDCETQVLWGEVDVLAGLSTVKSAGWGSKKFNCDSCQLPLIAIVVSKPFKSLTITKAG